MTNSNFTARHAVMALASCRSRRWHSTRQFVRSINDLLQTPVKQEKKHRQATSNTWTRTRDSIQKTQQEVVLTLSAALTLQKTSSKHAKQHIQLTLLKCTHAAGKGMHT